MTMSHWNKRKGALALMSNPTDEEIIQHELAVKGEATQDMPLVSEIYPIKELFNQLSIEFHDKIHSLNEKYSGYRKVIPDGNCFYRAMLFQLNQLDLSLKKKWFIERKAEFIKLLDLAGFERLAYEDFVDSFFSHLSGSEGIEEINGAIVFMRLIASAQLLLNYEQYAPFIPELADSSLESMKAFCSSNIDAFGKEADQISIISICEAFKVACKIAYITAGSDPLSFVHIGDEAIEPKIHLLFKPCHYDILVEK